MASHYIAFTRQNASSYSQIANARFAPTPPFYRLHPTNASLLFANGKSQIANARFAPTPPFYCLHPTNAPLLFANGKSQIANARFAPTPPFYRLHPTNASLLFANRKSQIANARFAPTRLSPSRKLSLSCFPAEGRYSRERTPQKCADESLLPHSIGSLFRWKAN
jgi:hypothetical protein